MRQGVLGFLLSFAFILGCQSDQVDNPANASSNKPLLEPEGVKLSFTMNVDREIYTYTDFGEPPQLAAWLENPDHEQVKTVWVSHRTGKNQWKGKVICPVSLPYWESRHKHEENSFRERSRIRRLIDALTGATPKGGEFTVSTHVPPGSRWEYYIEVNLSGDYNRDFPFWMEDGTPDPESNGQPSIIYRGIIEADSGFVNLPELAGRSHQLFPVDTLITDVSLITTAKKIFSSIIASCDG